MSKRPARALQAMELEERLLGLGALIGGIGVFLPWLSGDWQGSGQEVSFTGLNFYTEFLGICVLLLHLFLLCTIVIPAFGGPQILKHRYSDVTRLWISMQTVILSLAALSTLMRVSIELGTMEVRYGMYITLIGSLLALFESIVRYLEHRRSLLQDTFGHPEDTPPSPAQRHHLPPSPPPSAPPPEDHHPTYR